MEALRRFAAALVLVILGASPRASAQSTSVTGVMSCHDLTLARPQPGAASYSGLIDNGDYRFRVRIPAPFTGWGAALLAPFHGFAVFLNDFPESALQSCIVFEIHHCIENECLGQSPTPAAEWKPQKIGNRQGFRHTRIGSLNGVPFENVTSILELPQGDRGGGGVGGKDRLTVTFATPLRDRGRTEPILRAFISSFNFS
jgi:hypothetical protein